jgi:phenylacetate-CoA ligase
MKDHLSFQQDIYEMLAGSQFWPHQQLVAFQRQQLGQLIVFAQKNVPFYKDRLAPLVARDGTLRWERWQNVPILTRRDLAVHRDSMLASVLPSGHGKVADHEGSGTTGQPVVTRHNNLTALVSKTALYRAYGWFGIDYSGVFCQWKGNDPKVGKWPDGLDGGPWGPPWETASAQGRFLQINRETPVEHVAQFLAKKNARYFSSRPKSVQAVALAVERLGLNVKLDALSTYSTVVEDEDREDCRRVFGAEIIALYASKELYNIAHQCPRGTHYHVNSELVLLEVLDDEGLPCPVGVRGRAVITSFYNTAQPLIRYDLGDQIVMGGRCACGRTLPVIARIEGRTMHLFRFPDGRKIAPSLPWQSKTIIAASTWQIAQIEPLALEVRYVPDSSGKTADFGAFTAELQKRTDATARITYKKVDAIPLTPSGKLIQFVCELPPEGQGQ